MIKDELQNTEIIDGTGKNMDLIAGGGGYGWTEKWGQEIIDKEIVSRLEPDDVVVDLCSGEGRVTMPFAMRGTKVIAVDLNEKRIKEGDELRENAGARKVDKMIQDVKKLTREKLNGEATILIAGDSLNHFTKKDADKFINNISKLLNPNKRGLIYINVPATESINFQHFESFSAKKLDERTLEVECDCSGELKKEPIPFYSKGELQAMLALQGANILAVKEMERNGVGLLHEVVAQFKPKTDDIKGS